MGERELVKSVLMSELGFKATTAKNYEAAIFSLSESIASLTEDDIDKIYRNISYEKLGELISARDKEQRMAIFTNIKKGVIGFDSCVYSIIKEKTESHLHEIAEGEEVAEGEFTCRKCGSSKCSWVSVQTRSGDEAATIFVKCTHCGKRWKE
jgi:DNA-directed RNA polymerase subunit M/transcription elongation factor TFIIS